MKVLVAGGAGYIGSHTVKELLRDGFEVIIFDNFSTGREELVVGGEVITGDLMDKESIQNTFGSHDIQAVLHFASLIQVGTGRGIGLMFAISAVFLLVTSLVVFTSPRVRNLEGEIPDAIPE